MRGQDLRPSRRRPPRPCSKPRAPPGDGNKRGTGSLEARTEGGVAKKFVHNGQQAPIAHHAHDGATPLRRPGRRASALAPPKLNKSKRARSRFRSHAATHIACTSADGRRRAYLRPSGRVAHQGASKLGQIYPAVDDTQMIGLIGHDFVVGPGVEGGWGAVRECPARQGPAYSANSTTTCETTRPTLDR